MDLIVNVQKGIFRGNGTLSLVVFERYYRHTSRSEIVLLCFLFFFLLKRTILYLTSTATVSLLVVVDFLAD